MNIAAMTTHPQPDPYPGDGATAVELFRLAEEYRRAAILLAGIRRPGQPLSRAPFHLTAIHAIELYLNSLLLSQGMKPCALRKLHHDLSARVGHDLAAGLALRSRTTTHLADLSRRREYLISRYDTDQIKTLSQINQLQATLDEIQSKVAKRLGAHPATKAAVRLDRPVECHRQNGKTAERPASEAHILVTGQTQVS